MEDKRLFEGEYRLMDLIWEQEPIRSMDLVRLCLERLGWKKSTCFTVLKKLAQRGFVKNEKAVVDKSFGGSLPAFVTAFLSDRRLTEEEAEKLRDMINKAVEG